MSDKQMIYTLDQLDQAVVTLKILLNQCQVMTFTGDLGAGKTTLIRALLRDLGVGQPITSPTFTYVNRYVSQDGMIIYHFDLYRLHTLQEFMEHGFYEYLYQPNSRCLIEWPAIIIPLLTHDVCHITLDYGDDERTMRWDLKKG